MTLNRHASGIKSISRGNLNVCGAAADSYAQSSLDPIEKYVSDFDVGFVYLFDLMYYNSLFLVQVCLKVGGCEERTRVGDLGVYCPLVRIECCL